MTENGVAARGDMSHQDMTYRPLLRPGTCQGILSVKVWVSTGRQAMLMAAKNQNILWHVYRNYVFLSGLFIPSFFILERKVLGLIPRRAAPPLLPLICHATCFNVFNI